MSNEQQTERDRVAGFIFDTVNRFRPELAFGALLEVVVHYSYSLLKAIPKEHFHRGKERMLMDMENMIDHIKHFDLENINEQNMRNL